MTPTDHDVDSVDGDGHPGLNRRQMIKAAGIAGAAAWTAPMIIDSLSSPAAAATVAPGCYRMWQGFTSGGAAWGSWLSSAPNLCFPLGCGNDTNTAAAAVALSGTQPVDGSTTAVTITVNAGYSCRITSATAVVATDNAAVPGGHSCQLSGVATRVAFSFGTGSRSVTITPNGDQSGTNNDGFWDNSNSSDSDPIRSSIGIVLTCP